MRTVGVDLAAEAKATAVAGIDWARDGSARVVDLRLGADDDHILEMLNGADRAAIDCPLGWPEPFVSFLVAHRAGHLVMPSGMRGIEWRRTLSRRATDLACEQLTGVRPLSVAADRIAAVAMRGAGLLGALAAAGRPVDRSGAGTIVETYPAAALRVWGLPYQRYKGRDRTAALGQLVDELVAVAPLDLGGAADLCRQSDDALDAVLCALVARAAALGTTTRPPTELLATASLEGWIALPTEPLPALFRQIE